MSNLIQDAEDAIAALFGDTHVGQQVTKDRLEELIEFIRDRINALEIEQEENHEQIPPKS